MEQSLKGLRKHVENIYKENNNDVSVDMIISKGITTIIVKYIDKYTFDEPLIDKATEKVRLLVDGTICKSEVILNNGLLTKRNMISFDADLLLRNIHKDISDIEDVVSSYVIHGDD